MENRLSPNVWDILDWSETDFEILAAYLQEDGHLLAGYKTTMDDGRVMFFAAKVGLESGITAFSTGAEKAPWKN